MGGVDIRRLLQVPGGNPVHIIERLVFAAHGPDEGIASGARSGVDGPGGGDHRVVIAHDDVPGLLVQFMRCQPMTISIIVHVVFLPSLNSLIMPLRHAHLLRDRI